MVRARLREYRCHTQAAAHAHRVPLLDHLVEEGEVVPEPGGGEALHEADRLAQLHLEDRGEVAVRRADEPEVHGQHITDRQQNRPLVLDASE